MDPTLHYKMKGDEVYDGSGEGLQPRYRTRRTRCEPMMAADSETLETETETDSCKC